MSGDVVAGRHRLEAEIGAGGMGEVWRGRRSGGPARRGRRVEREDRGAPGGEGAQTAAPAGRARPRRLGGRRSLGNQLDDQLIRELVRSATLMPTDLHRLDDWADG
ncbi:hypothetical protein GCM10009559_65220 [Pseudonocardia zijingensis]|uniref:Uncharacterized protein n=1 Tax=Pseudonocardia zijingensis TaxID=153376 RepID=A0ABP3YN06_9PSEU